MCPRLAGFLSLPLCLIWGDRADSRKLESWPDEKLFAQADLVVISKLGSTRDGGKDTPTSPRDYLKPVLTTVQIVDILKGNPKENRVTILHHRIDRDQARHGIRNGPTLMEFDPGETYLVFLKTRPDGFYEAVSGRFDTGLSLQRVLDIRICDDSRVLLRTLSRGGVLVRRWWSPEGPGPLIPPGEPHHWSVHAVFAVVLMLVVTVIWRIHRRNCAPFLP
jgi:hypothetical protein